MKKNQTILFDGVCNLCNFSVGFIKKRDKKNLFKFIALQTEKGKQMRQKFNFPQDIDSIILIENESVFTESDAAIEILCQMPIPWNWFVVLKIIPKKWRDKIYKGIAKNRYGWFGKSQVCRIT